MLVARGRYRASVVQASRISNRPVLLPLTPCTKYSEARPTGERFGPRARMPLPECAGCLSGPAQRKPPGIARQAWPPREAGHHGRPPQISASTLPTASHLRQTGGAGKSPPPARIASNAECLLPEGDVRNPPAQG